MPNLKPVLRPKFLKTPRTTRVRWLFLRAMGLVSFAAWTSLSRQVLGLFGSRGIAPLNDRMDRLRGAGVSKTRVPSLFWFDASDRTLTSVCRAGQLASLLLTFNVAPKASAAVSWLGYGSFVTVGQPFLSYQWDTLLLETTAQTVLSAPSGLRPGLGKRAPSFAEVLMFRWLAFRLHFESGISKLQSHDETWRDLTACAYHQQTQPLPTRAGWYAHHLPRRVQKAVTAGVLFSEVVVPPLALMPGPLRRVAFWWFIALQAAIQLTGNYGFFNVLTAAVSLWLTDDDHLPVRNRKPLPPPSLLQTAVEALLLAPTATASMEELVGRFRPHLSSDAMTQLMIWASRLHLTSPYGLFAMMTTSRPEISIETSDDGEHWRELPFRHKPTRLDRPPRISAPHMPRLDWQMWFAALGRMEPWVLSFIAKLLEGSDQVRKLLPKDAFTDGPPRYVRAKMYDYKMTSLEERKKTGAWWKRGEATELIPAVSLNDGTVRP